VFADRAVQPHSHWLTANRGILKSLVAAIYAAADWANANHNATAAILSKYTQVDVALILPINRNRFATVLDPRLIQPVEAAEMIYHA
jgi:ABC-type nitrate/sulfonate/bicarbonate transport system substrate-binding protein